MQRICKLLLVTIVSLLVAIACNNNSLEPTTSQLASSEREYRLIEDAIATVKVPLDPQRIVTLHGTALESVLALGSKPVGTVLNGKLAAQPDFLRQELTDVELLGSFSEPSLENILLLQPDLILDLDTSSIYSQLSQIAPVVVSNGNSANSWQASLRLYGKALGKSEMAEQIIANYYQRLTKLEEKLTQQSKQITVSVIRIYPDEISFYQPDSFSGSILKDAGISRPPLQSQGGVQKLIGRELISEVDADVIFYWTYGDDYHSKEDRIENSLNQLKSDPLWQQLNAVKQGKVYQVPEYWIGYGVLAANAVIDDLEQYLFPQQN